MSIERNQIRWNGWGSVEEDYGLEDRANAFWGWAGSALGMKAVPDCPAPSLDDTQMADPALTDEALAALKAICGERIKTDKFERAFHARGKSYPDLVVVRSGTVDPAPDAVAYPETADEVHALLKAAAEHKLAVIPYGGGSSVVGAINAAKRDDQAGIVVVDTTLMDKLISIDEEALTATIQAGAYGPQLEAQLQEQGYTLGHYPQSFEYSTLGGWISARGAGQQSNKFGKAEKWFVSARVATPQGAWNTEPYPASAAGPNLNQLVLGHEGTLGIITDATVRVQRLPETRDYRGFFMPDYFSGIAAIRDMVQAGLPVAMTRLSDPNETEFFQKAATVGTPKARQLGLLLKLLRFRVGKRPCLMLIGVEGEGPKVEGTRDAVRAIVKRHGGVHTGTIFSSNWYKQRFHSPYLRDPMLDHGIAVDTLETATTWSNMRKLYDAVMAALDTSIKSTLKDGQKCMVMCHVSHSYPDGASLYFTYVWPQDLEAPMEQWQRIKAAASDAILATGGTISHHHGVGTDHKQWFEQEKGDIGLAALKGVKQAIDPDGILNPNKSFG